MRIRPKSRKRARVSLTPLVDVVFILLLFFMLSSSFTDWRSIAMSAPAVAGGGDAAEGAVLVRVHEDGSLDLNGRPLALEAIAGALRPLLRDNPEQRVLVRPADEVPLQRLVAVVDAIGAAGAVNLTFLR